MAGNQEAEQQERLKKIRIALGLSQTDFAKELNVAQTYLSKIETGGRGISRNLINRLAAKYPGLNIQWLVTGKGEMQLIGGDLPTQASTGNSVQLTGDLVQLSRDLMANEPHTTYGSPEEQIKHLRLRIRRLEQFILKKFPDYPIDEL